MPQRAQKTVPSTPGPSTASGSGSGGAHGGGSSGHGHGTPAPDEAPLISAPGTYSIADVVVGCKIFVEKPDLATGEVEQRLAEILSVRERPKPRRLGAGAAAARAEDEARPAEEKLEYYVHYAEFNKRLDEWVSGKRLIFTREMTWPKPVAPAAPPNTGTGRKKTARPSVSGTPGTPGTPSAGPSRTASSNLLKKAAMAAASQTQDQTLDGGSSTATPGAPRVAPSAPSPQTPSRGSSSSAPMTPGTDGDVEMDDATQGGVGEHAAVVTVEMVGETSEANAEEAGEAASVNRELHPNARQSGTFDKAAEIEKLRTSGSMTQSVHEVSRVKNLNRIQMGAHEIETWYFSPYPIEFAHVDTLYVCEMCLCYFPTAFIMARHRKKCGLVHPPGNEIYRHEDISFFEIDGRRQKTWCRNLCLLSKCFLDHKSVYYDVDPFLYYVMAQRDDAGAHIIGYFSKEKESAENYNVACILTLPQHQRAGFGKLLIEFSYELTKREHKLGSPEKPLSDLGLLGYRAYWAETIVELLLRTEEEISIDEIANRTAIVHGDILHTCTALNMLKHYQGKHYIVLSDIVLQNHEKQMKKKRRRIVPERLNWEPPRFTREQLRFGY